MVTLKAYIHMFTAKQLNRMMTCYLRSKIEISFLTVCIIFVVLVIYWPGLTGPLLLDDGQQLLPILKESSSTHWWKLFKEHIISNSGVLGRPVSMFSFLINAFISGESIWQWKLTNVILHLLCGISIFVLTQLIISFNKSNAAYSTKAISFCIALIWTVHPLHVSTVLYLVQRMTILSTLFTTLALSCYIYAIKLETKNNQGSIYLYFISIFVLLPLSLFSKENAILFPAYSFLSTIYILKNPNSPINKLPTKARIYYHVTIASVLFIIVALIVNMDSLVLSGYRLRDFSLQTRLLTETRVLFNYIFQILYPFPSVMGFFHDDFEISNSILSPITTLLSVLSITLVITICTIKFKKHSLTCYGLLFFFASHLLESTIIPLEIAFEHRNYLGTWGIIIAISSLLTGNIKKTSPLLIIIVTTFAILASNTYKRSVIWSNPNDMYSHMLSVHPDSKRLRIIYSNAYINSKNYSKALEYLSDDSPATQLRRLYVSCLQNGKISAQDFFNIISQKTTLKIGTSEMDSIVSLSNLGLDNKCIFSKKDFSNFLSTIVKSNRLQDTDAQKLLLYLAHYNYQLGDKTNAINSLQESYLKNPENPIPLFLLVEWLIGYGDIDSATQVFTNAKLISEHVFADYTDFITRISALINQAYLKHNHHKKHIHE